MPASPAIDSPDALPPLQLRMRPDLIVAPQDAAADGWWVVKDPVTLEYFQLDRREAAVLRMLDGRRSFESIRREFERRFAPRRLTPEGLQAYLEQLHRYGLVLSDAPGQGGELRERRDRRQSQARRQLLAGALYYRFRGVDPEPLLRRVYPLIRPLFSRGFLLLVLAAASSALGLVLLRLDQLEGRLPPIDAFLTAGNVAWLTAILVAVKVLHELAHALACKHFGGECHEIGIMLFFGMPFLYCNVSDAWMFPHRWHRIAVSAAGMIAEMLLASIAAWVWYWSQPGLLNTLAFNLTVVCSVRTIVLNANPLLRYDGYYILCDLAQVPNLYQRAGAALSSSAVRWCTGLELPAEEAVVSGCRGWLALYAAASIGYRLLIVLTILSFAYLFLKPYGLQTIAIVLGVMYTAQLFWAPIRRIARLVGAPELRRRMSIARLAFAACLVLAAGAAVFLIPLPTRVSALARIEPADLHRVYVTVPGRVKWALPAGTMVRPGDVLAELSSFEVEQELVAMAGLLDRQRLRVKHLEIQQIDDSQLAAPLPAERESLKVIEARLEQLERDRQDLVIKAPAAGQVLSPPLEPAVYEPGRLRPFDGSPLEEQNTGCYLPAGSMLCLVGKPSRPEAVLLIDQAHVALTKPGQAVRLTFDETPGEVVYGVLEEIAASHLESLPDELAAGNLVARDVRGEAPMETFYEARVRLHAPLPPLLMGTRGHAKITADPSCLWRRAARYWKRTFGT